MKDLKITEKKFQEMYDELLRMAEEASSVSFGQDDESSEIYQNYSLDTEKGFQFYLMLSDKMLLNVLRNEAKKRNHSPAQKEVFWVWREYIKKRFQKWPYALNAAGLSKSAGSGGKTLQQSEAEKEEYQQLLNEVRKKAEELCRIPHPQELPELCEKLGRFTNSWNDVIRDSALDSHFFRRKSVYKIESLEPEYLSDLQNIKNISEKLGRAPLKSEIENETKKKLIVRCESWRNVLYQVGLEPVVKINPFSTTHVIAVEKEKVRRHNIRLQNCYYKILNPDEQTAADLQELYQIQIALGHIPDKKEISWELRKRLQQSCGSFANALFQLEYMKKRKEE